MKIIPTVISYFFPILLFAGENHFIVANDVVWNSPGTNENDSMPIGNGGLAANVWTETNGRVTGLKVIPASRAKDIVILGK